MPYLALSVLLIGNGKKEKNREWYHLEWTGLPRQIDADMLICQPLDIPSLRLPSQIVLYYDKLIIKLFVTSTAFPTLYINTPL